MLLRETRELDRRDAVEFHRRHLGPVFMRSIEPDLQRRALGSCSFRRRKTGLIGVTGRVLVYWVHLCRGVT